MNYFHIYNITWYSSDYSNPVQEDYNFDTCEPPEQIIINTKHSWSDDLYEMIAEKLFEVYGFEPTEFEYDVLDDKCLLDELKVLKI